MTPPNERRNFLQRFGAALVVAAIAPKVLTETPEPLTDPRSLDNLIVTTGDGSTAMAFIDMPPEYTVHYRRATGDDAAVPEHCRCAGGFHDDVWSLP